MHQMLQKSDRKSFPRANLIDSKLDYLIMHGFSFDDVDLTQASLKECDLGLASFVGAKLWKAYLVGSNLSSANFTDAMLWDADLSNTNLENATIITSKVNEKTNFAGALLKGAKISNSVATVCNIDPDQGATITA